MHKAVHEIVSIAAKNRCGTIVTGCSRQQKQNANMGHVTNQNFVQIPHTRFRGMLKAKCGQPGIRFIEQGESYTSKASAPGDDPIPAYGERHRPADLLGQTGEARPV